MIAVSACPRCRGKIKGSSRDQRTCLQCGFDPGPSSTTQALVTRRSFLKLTAGFALAGLVVGCTSSANDTASGPSANGPLSGGTSNPSGNGPANGGTSASDPRVQSFMALSALITGVDRSELAPDVAGQLLPLIDQHIGSGMTVDQLANAAGVSGGSQGKASSLDAALGQPGAMPTAELIAAAWYSGEGPGDGKGEGELVTYNDALAWRALSFTSAPCNCGGPFGYWSERPAA